MPKTKTVNTMEQVGEVAATLDSVKPESLVAQLEKAADEHLKKVEESKNALTPMQVIGTFTEHLAKPTAKVVKSLYSDLLDEFTKESTSRIAIGNTLNRLREELGENFRTFLKECVITTLRKSQSTCYNYMALSDAANITFAKNRPVRDSLFRIWGAEGCYDTENGKLLPVVNDAILACGGIPESSDSVTSEQWSRKFVTTVDKLLRNGRKAEPGGRSWDASTIGTKNAQVVKAFRAFIRNKSVSKDLALNLFTDVVYEAMMYGHFTDSEFDECIDKANERFAERNAKIEADNPDETERKPSKKAA
jgi:hypothetical protein